MANTHSTLTGLFSDIADAIRAKTGGTDSIVADKFPEAIAAISSGGSASPSDVNFYDYDGTIVKSYTAQEFLALSAMPDNPSHVGLTAQGWNWSLSDAQSYVADCGKLEIGQMYITDDGKTRLYLTIEDITRPLTTIYFQATVDGGVTIDWGDGSATETSSGTAAKAYTHNYAAAGDYVITLAVTSGNLVLTGTSGTTGYGVMGARGDSNRYKTSRLQRVEIGGGVTSIGSYVFYSAYGLRSITIPSGINGLVYSFQSNNRLTHITLPGGMSIVNAISSLPSVTSIAIPNGVTSIGAYALQGNSMLARLTIPSSVRTLGTASLASLFCLTRITIPGGVTSIAAQSFQNCYGMKEYHILPTTPPTLANTNAFGGIPDDCIIYVPQGCLEAYQSATNWSTYASYMQEEPT